MKAVILGLALRKNRLSDIKGEFSLQENHKSPNQKENTSSDAEGMTVLETLAVNPFIDFTVKHHAVKRPIRFHIDGFYLRVARAANCVSGRV